ncbi:hypothetical protein M569_17320 [Genlisea aurea]|uniref:Uncharacterized protein n=1 Tax=Genlisea aurea TaxID=192259 RepID=S8D4C3_9LAMI|nr:hypothetical protein M569_17320 [Genlisea aurea]
MWGPPYLYFGPGSSDRWAGPLSIIETPLDSPLSKLESVRRRILFPASSKRGFVTEGWKKLCRMIAVGGRIWRVLRNLTSSSPRLFEPLRRLPMNLPAPPSARFFSYKNESLTPNSVTMEMIQYAMSVAREQITEESLSRGLLVLEQCESMLSDDNSKGFVELARSTLLFER